MRVRAIVDPRAEPDIGAASERDALVRAGTECLAGHAVLATPARLTPAWWLARPITTKTSTQITSASTPRAARTGPG